MTEKSAEIINELSTKELVKKWLKFIKDNLSIILFIPTFLGGSWQVFKLVSIGYPFIRFFSISQLIADGLLLLLPLLLIITFSYNAYYYNKINRKVDLLFIIFIIITTILSLYTLYNIIILFLKVNYKFFIYLGPYIMFYATLFVSIVFSLIVFFPKDTKKAEDYDKKYIEIINRIYQWFVKRLAKFIWCVSLFNFVVYLIWFVNYINSSDIPENFHNMYNVSVKMMKEYKYKYEDFEIVYFNDSYIFIKHFEVNEKEKDSLNRIGVDVPYEIIVLKSDVLFEHQAPRE